MISAQVEWFYPALRHLDTHIAVDCWTVVDRLRQAQHNNSRLRANALRVYDEFVSPRGLARYFYDVATALRAKLLFPTVLDDPQSRRTALTQLNCSRLLLAEVLTREDPKRHHDDDDFVTTYALKAIRPDDPVLGPCSQEDAAGNAFLRTELRRLTGGDSRWTFLPDD